MLKRGLLKVPFQGYQMEVKYVWWYTYSHLSNKRGGTFIDFEKKFHPPRTFPPLTFIDFLDFFHPPLLVYCSYLLVFFQKIPPSTFMPTSSTIREKRISKQLYNRTFNPKWPMRNILMNGWGMSGIKHTNCLITFYHGVKTYMKSNSDL